MRFATIANSLLGLTFLLGSTVNSAATKPTSVTLAWDAAPRTIDPRFTIDAKSHYLSDLQHCALISFDENGKSIGNLAKSWVWKDGKTLDIIIKSGIKFSNGKTLTGDDVKATYDFFKREDLKKPSPLAGAFKKIKKIDVSGNKLSFHFEEADTSFIQNLMIGILPKDLASKEMFEKPGDYVGCGPFTLTKSNVSGLELVRNKHYNISSPSKTDKIIIKIVKDELTRFAKLQKGEVDLVQDGISRDKIKNISKKMPSLRIVKRPGLNVTYLGFNMKDKILSKRAVREAIALGIDRKKNHQIHFARHGHPSSQYVNSQRPLPK